MISLAVVVSTMMMLLDTAGRCWEPKPMPSPFGISSDCNTDSSFCITCNYSYDPPKPFLNWESMQALSTHLSGDVNFSKITISIFKNPVPDVLDWSAAANLSCSQVQKSVSSSARRAAKSECVDSSSEAGYHYFVSKPYTTRIRAVYRYSRLLEDDGEKDGWGHSPQRQTIHSILFCICFVSVVPAVVISWIIRWSKQKKVVKLRRDLFLRNGGEILEAKKSVQKTFSVFTAEDLKKATNNYDESNVLCHEHTYKGKLPEANCGVTIQFCREFDRCNIEILISKLVALSQIRHENVVKLLGCCLETQVPLVVYEFITCKTLSDCINDDCLARSLSWDIRLRIAADTAGALACLHSAAIIHGSLDSSSILVDHGYTVKVSGFSLTCSECCCVQFYYGDTSSYLDPDYFSSGQLTEKSDVYSFGFILAELLTGKGVMSPQGEEKLVKYFVGASSGGDFVGILDDRLVTDDDNVGQLREVADIARRCLSSSSQGRPTIKEVAVALECVLMMD